MNDDEIMKEDNYREMLVEIWMNNYEDNMDDEDDMDDEEFDLLMEHFQGIANMCNNPRISHTHYNYAAMNNHRRSMLASQSKFYKILLNVGEPVDIYDRDRKGLYRLFKAIPEGVSISQLKMKPFIPVEKNYTLPMHRFWIEY